MELKKYEEATSAGVEIEFQVLTACINERTLKSILPKWKIPEHPYISLRIEEEYIEELVIISKNSVVQLPI